MYSAARRPADRRRRGLSLLEALAAMAMISSVLLGFAAHAISVTRTAKSADSVAVGTALALEQLEQLRSMPLGSPELTPGQYYDDDNPLQADGTPGGIFNRSWTVSADDTPGFGLRTVEVTISWSGSRAQATSVAAYIRCSTVPCS